MSNGNIFSKEELQRYSRHMVLPQFGIEGQQKLKNASILIVGAGGLGCPVLQYLTAAGIGKIGIVDNDLISISNLQRQILYSVDDIGQNKAIVASQKLERLNPSVERKVYALKITAHNALDLMKGYDIVIDCTDNFPTRYLLNDACVLLNIPLIYGSIFRYEGQVAVFNFKNSPNYRDLYPEPPAPGSVPDCEQGGVLGVLPGLIGCIQSNEAIKLITGIGEPLVGKLLALDSLTMEVDLFTIPDKNERSRIKKLIDYDDFCGIRIIEQKKSGMKEVSVLELKKMKDSGEDFQLIDVREPHEYEICNLGGELIPLAEIPHNVDKISTGKKVVVHCRSGKRSGEAIKWLEKNHPFENLFNLAGGVLAWSDEVDPSMPKY